MTDTANKIEATEPHGDVNFWIETDGEVLRCEIGWGHCDRKHFTGSDEEWSACGFGLYQSGDLHDGYGSLRELLDYMPEDVYLSLADYRAGRSVKLEAVIDAARAWAKLKPIAECSDVELDPHDDETEDDT